VTAYPHKYKTVMCKNFLSGTPCPFGKNCNYAHGEEQLKKFSQLRQIEQAPKMQEIVKVEEPKFQPEAPIFKSSKTGSLDWASKLCKALSSGGELDDHSTASESSYDVNRSQQRSACESTSANTSHHSDRLSDSEQSPSNSHLSLLQQLSLTTRCVLSPLQSNNSATSNRPIYSRWLDGLEDQSKGFFEDAIRVEHVDSEDSSSSGVFCDWLEPRQKEGN